MIKVSLSKKEKLLIFTNPKFTQTLFLFDLELLNFLQIPYYLKISCLIPHLSHPMKILTYFYFTHAISPHHVSIFYLQCMFQDAHLVVLFFVKCAELMM
jgi:hypothetical protein